MASLKAVVYLTDPDGSSVRIGPGDHVPDWAVEQITNPDCWDDEPAVEGEATEPEPEADSATEPEPAKRTARKR